MSEAARSNRQYTEDPQGSNDSLSYVTQPFLLVIALNGLMKTLIFILPSGVDGVSDLRLPVQRQRRGKVRRHFLMSTRQWRERSGWDPVASQTQTQENVLSVKRCDARWQAKPAVQTPAGDSNKTWRQSGWLQTSHRCYFFNTCCFFSSWW